MLNTPFRRCGTILLPVLLVASAPSLARAQRSQQAASRTSTLSMRTAVDLAIAASADLVAAREVVATTRGRERQAGALTNPVLSYSREQSGGGSPVHQRSSQDILSVDQMIDWSATREARTAAARYRKEAAQARVAVLESQLAFDVARAYAAVLSADRRAALADETARTFDQARTVSEKRLAAGDVSGYAARRIRLETARYATLRAEAMLQRRSARIALGSLVSARPDSIAMVTASLSDSVFALPAAVSMDSVIASAIARRADLRALELEASAASADALLARRERRPSPTITAGTKFERAPGAGSLAGFVAGVSIPLPLWDKRVGTIDAADAESRRRQAEIVAARRRVTKELADATDALQAIDEQIAILTPQVASDAGAALRAAQTAYAEGEITLLEWLDAVRAYQETESAYAGLRSELFTRRAALARAAGVSIPEDFR